MEETRYIYFDYEELKAKAAKIWGEDCVCGAEGEFEVNGIIARYPISGGREAAMFLISIAEDGREESLRETLCKNQIIDAACQLVEDELKEEAKNNGWELSALMGPGYGDRPVEETKILVESLRGESIGVSANSEGVMTPAFSRCGYYYLGENLKDVIDFGCGACCSSCIGDSQGCAMCPRSRNGSLTS